MFLVPWSRSRLKEYTRNRRRLGNKSGAGAVWKKVRSRSRLKFNWLLSSVNEACILYFYHFDLFEKGSIIGFLLSYYDILSSGTWAPYYVFVIILETAVTFLSLLWHVCVDRRVGRAAPRHQGHPPPQLRGHLREDGGQSSQAYRSPTKKKSPINTFARYMES